MAQELVALERQLDALSLPLEQQEAEIGFERPDRFRHRRLRNRKLVRRARHRALLRRGHEVLDLSERKRHADERYQRAK